MAAINPLGLLGQAVINAALMAQQQAQQQGAAVKKPPAYTPAGSNTDEEIRNKDPQSWDAIQKLKDEYERAKTQGDTGAMQSAHQAAEDIRGMFGYSGGRDGSEYFATGAQNQAQALYNAAIAELQRAGQAQQAAAQAAVEQYIASLSGQIPQIERSAADANAGAYQNYLRAVNPFGAGAQQQAQLGLQNSGFAESSLTSLGNTYQDVLGKNEQARQDYLFELEQAKRQAVLDGGLENAARLADTARLVADKRFEQGKSLLEHAAQQGSLALRQQQQEYKMSQDERSQMEYLAALLAQYGIFDGYRALGLPAEQVSAMEAYWRALRK